jgi:NADPH:quinone reductase
MAGNRAIDTKRHEAEQKAAHHKIPEVMQAAAIDRFGGPEVLTIHELRTPEAGDGEVLIAVHTAGVASWDAEMRAGWYPGGHPRLPLVLGTDGSGRVAAVGAGVRRFQAGAAVYAYSFANAKGGFYAQYVAVAADNVAPIPEGLTMRAAGAIGTTGLTAIQGIDDALQVRKGEAVAIVGASGGVGTLAVQFAKLREARVLGIASGEDGVKLAKRLGADAALDGRSADFADALREFAPEGLAAVLGLAGGKMLERVLQSISDGGRVAYPNGVEPAPAKRHGIQMIPYDAVPGVREFEHLGKAIEAAKLQVPIAARFPLPGAQQAHERLAQGHILGKVVLDIE